MSLLRASVALVLLGAWEWPAFGCRLPESFVCEDDTQCIDADRIGTCEAPGWCAYEDGTCPSGKRFGDGAGDGMQGQCVEPLPDSVGGTGGTQTTTGTSAGSDPGGSTDGMSGTASSGSGGTTTAPGGSCPDGNLDPGESCDDGNFEVGDGCNPDCRPSGELVWSKTYDADGQVDRAFGLALEADQILVAGQQVVNDEPDIVVLAYDVDGEMSWVSTAPNEQGGSDQGRAIAVGDGAIWVAGQWTVETVEYPVLCRFELDGTHAWAVAGQTSGTARAVAVTPEDVILGGSLGWGSSARMFVSRHEVADGSVVDLVTDEPSGRLNALAVAGSETYAVGFRGADIGDAAELVVDRLGPTGFEPVALVESPGGFGEGQAIAVGSSGDLFVGGYLRVAPDVPKEEPRDAWVGRMTPSGRLAWSDLFGSPQDQFSDEIEAVAVTPEGDVVVAGFEFAVGHDFFVRRYGADGQVKWTWTHDTAGGDDTVRAIAVADDGSIFAAGEVEPDGPGTPMDVWVARLTP